MLFDYWLETIYIFNSPQWNLDPVFFGSSHVHDFDPNLVCHGDLCVWFGPVRGGTYVPTSSM